MISVEEQPANNETAPKVKRSGVAKKVEENAERQTQQANAAEQMAQPQVERERPLSRRSKKLELGLEEQLLFGKYNLKEVMVTDQSLAAYINLLPRRYPDIYGRRSNLAYYTSHINIVERLMNKLMRGGTGQKVGGRVIRTKGRLQGKKLKVFHIVEKAFDIVNRQTSKNPVQIFINALQHAAPIEDTTRVRYGGISYNVAVDLGSTRRVGIALSNIALASIMGAFKNRRSLAESLANEIILAANKDPNSYAIKKRVEAERMARSAR